MLYVNELVREGLSASHSRGVLKAVNLFLQANECARLSYSNNDLPYEEALGAIEATHGQVRALFHACSGEYGSRNEALVMFLKDCGLRVSDVARRSVEEYLRAKGVAEAAGFPGFAAFDPIITRKKKTRAWPVVGPEATDAVDKYLAGRTSGPLFLGRVLSGRRGEKTGEGRLDEGSMSVLFLRLKSNLDDGGHGISANSLRKFHSTTLAGKGGIHGVKEEDYIDRLEGRKLRSSREPYFKPRDLLRAYAEAYDSLRVLPHRAADVREQDDKITALEDELRKVNAALESLAFFPPVSSPRLDSWMTERRQEHYEALLRGEEPGKPKTLEEKDDR